MTGIYRVRVRRGDVEVEVESNDKNFVERHLEQQMAAALAVAKAPSHATTESEPPCGTRRPLSLREFYKQVSPKQMQQRAATIAYYVEHMSTEKVEEWKPTDIETKWADTGEKKRPGNLAGTIRQSTFFSRIRPGQYRLSNTGLEWVEGELERDDNHS